MAVATDDILEILKKSGLVFVLGLSLHETDLLNLTLKDQESVVLKVNTFGAEEFADFLEVLLNSINPISRYALSIHCAGNLELRAGNDLILVWLIFIIENVLEMHPDSSMLDIFMLS